MFDHTRDGCSPTDIPDAPARAFRDTPGRAADRLPLRHAADVGPDLTGAPPLRRGDGLGPRPQPGATSPTGVDRRPVLAPTAERSTRSCTTSTRATSTSNAARRASTLSAGTTRSRLRSRPTAAAPSSSRRRPPTGREPAVRYEPDAGRTASSSPSNIVRNDDGYYYALLQAPALPGPAQRHVPDAHARLDGPASWRAWDGSSYSVRFVNPYRSRGRPRTTLRARLLRRDRGHDAKPHLQHLSRQVRARVPWPTPAGRGGSVGLYYSLSDDLIDWEPRES